MQRILNNNVSSLNNLRNNSMNETFPPLNIVLGSLIMGKYRVIQAHSKHKQFQLFTGIHERFKYHVTIKAFFKSPIFSKIAEKESNLFLITNTIDFDHKYFAKYLGYDIIDDSYVLVFVKMGPTMKEQLDNLDGIHFSLNTVRSFMWQLLHAIQLLHENKIILGNLTSHSISFLQDYVDENGYELKTGKREIGLRINTLSYALDGTKWHVLHSGQRKNQPPEAVLQIRWSLEADLYMLGLILFEITTGKRLFSADDTLELLAQIEKIGGSFPQWMVDESPVKATQDIFEGHVDLFKLTEAQRVRVENFKSLDEVYSDEAILNFASILLSTDPTKRCDLSVLYDHPFFAQIS